MVTKISGLKHEKQDIYIVSKYLHKTYSLMIKKENSNFIEKKVWPTQSIVRD